MSTATATATVSAPASSSPSPTKAKRFKFVFDTDTRFEECNGEARPLTASEYKEHAYMGCPVHPRAGLDPHKKRPGVGVCRLCRRRGTEIPYAEYLAYYGNPDRYVYVGLLQAEQCDHCGEWKETGSQWGIGFMDDDAE